MHTSASSGGSALRSLTVINPRRSQRLISSASMSSHHSPTRCWLTSIWLTVFTAARKSCIRALSWQASVSSAATSLTSVAVVITGSTPRMSARCRARLFAPPICPESRLMTCWPRSSITTTAGSWNLSISSGASVRTAIPVAPIKISAVSRWNACPTLAAKPPSNGRNPGSTSPSRV